MKNKNTKQDRDIVAIKDLAIKVLMVLPGQEDATNSVSALCFAFVSFAKALGIDSELQQFMLTSAQDTLDLTKLPAAPSPSEPSN